MKRSAYDEDVHDSEDAPAIADSPSSLRPNSLEKRARSGSPPVIVGPLTFSPDGMDLYQALVPPRVSNLPGVYRLVPAHVPVRLYAPHWQPQLYLETDLAAVLNAVDRKCVLLFDTRPAEVLSPTVLFETEGAVPLGWLLGMPIIQRRGILVSRNAPDSPDASRMPFVQDPSGTLARQCNVHEYLGPCAVLVINGEVIATVLLRRRADDIMTMLEEWGGL